MCRINFVPCNRQDHFVIEIHVKAGLPSEIYADREDKASGWMFAFEYTFCSAALLDVDKKRWLSSRSSLAQGDP